MPISIRTEEPLIIETERPVSVKSEGGLTIITVEAPAAVEVSRDDGSGDDESEDDTKDPRCGVIMARSRKPCARRQGHNGVHMTAEQVKRKQEYNRKRARERYRDDPEYAERVREQVRRSSRKA